MQSAQFQISQNVRYLLWQRGVERSSWVAWLVRECQLDQQRVGKLVRGELHDGEIPTREQAQLCQGLGVTESELRFEDLPNERTDILLENLKFLFSGLERGGKKEVAFTLQVDPTTVSRWLNGTSQPNRTTQDAVSRFFGLPRDTDLRKDPLFLSVSPVAAAEQKRWIVQQVENMSSEELRELYPALRRMLGDR